MDLEKMMVRTQSRKRGDGFLLLDLILGNASFSQTFVVGVCSRKSSHGFQAENVAR